MVRFFVQPISITGIYKAETACPNVSASRLYEEAPLMFGCSKVREYVVTIQ